MLQCGPLSGRNMWDRSNRENPIIQKKAVKKPASFISRDFGRKKVFHLDDQISPFTHNLSSNILIIRISHKFKLIFTLNWRDPIIPWSIHLNTWNCNYVTECTFNDILIVTNICRLKNQAILIDSNLGWLRELSNISPSQINIHKQWRIQGITVHFNLIRRRERKERRKGKESKMKINESNNSPSIAMSFFMRLQQPTTP